MENPSVTAVVAAYNEERSIKACVESLRAQEFSPLEVIIVDDGSSDSTREIVRSLGVRMIEQRHRGPGSARNLGAREAGGNILFFVDADMTFARDYVSRLAAPLIAGEACGTSHGREIVSNWDNRWARLQTWFLGCPDRTRGDLYSKGGTTVYRAVRKDFFLAAGGFREDEGRGDDASLSARTGLNPLMVAGALCYHSNASCPREAFLDARWRGRNYGLAISSMPALLRAVFWDRNIIRDIVAGARLLVSKREPLALFYALVFGYGFQCGIFSAYFRKNYLK